MARARNIKPGFYKNEDLAECSVWARYIFPGLWMLADREGRLEDRPKRIKGELIPFDAQDVEPLLRELQTRGFILRYQIEGASYIQISKFKEHQSPHYSEKQSVIKPPILPESKAHIDPPISRKIPRIKRGSQHPDSLNPDSPIPDSLIADSLNPEPRKEQKHSAALRASEPGKTLETWNSYCQAYQDRYGVPPVRNAKVNGQLGRLIDQLGAEDAPPVAAFYLTHNAGLYMSAGHCIDLLLRDCAKLRTEWATGRKVTKLEIKSVEQVDGVRAQIERVGKFLEEKKHAAS